MSAQTDSFAGFIDVVASASTSLPAPTSSPLDYTCRGHNSIES